MGHKKLLRFNAIKEFENVLEYPENIKGKWAEFFGNKNPIVLELACGKGEYTTGRAEIEKKKNFIGIDVKGNRMYIGAKYATEKGLANAAFLRINIDKIEDFFEPNEISEIWIIFPDPFLRDKQSKNRLTHTKFLAKYQNILPKGSTINLKTDSPQLYEFTKEQIAENHCKTLIDNPNIYDKGEAPFPLSIKTFYEKMHLEDNRIIRYLSFELPEKKIVYVKKKKEDEE